jgi:hypothetical protein
MTTVGGLPAHILLVHTVVGLVPVTALLVVLIAVWPAAPRRLMWVAAGVALVTLVSVPVTTEAGEWLEHRVERTALLRVHTELGDTMLPWAIGLAVIAFAILARTVIAERAARRAVPVGGNGPGTARAPAAPRAAVAGGPGGRVVSLILAVLAVVVAVGRRRHGGRAAIHVTADSSWVSRERPWLWHRWDGAGEA